MNQAPSENVVFFDGVCNLCNRSVDFLMRIDREERLKFASLQGETAQKRLPPDALLLSTIVMTTNDEPRLFKKSEAVLKALEIVGGPWSLLVVFRLIPVEIRDGIYDWVAQNRYKWFGQRDICRFPTPAERARFLP